MSWYCQPWSLCALVTAGCALGCGQGEPKKLPESPPAQPLAQPATIATDAAVARSAEAGAAAARAPTWTWQPQPDLYPLADLWVDNGEARFQLGQRPIPVPSARAFSRAGTPRLVRHSQDGHIIWTVDLLALRDDHLAGAAMIADDQRVYIVHYNRIASGCQLSAYSAEDGGLLWSTALLGIGPIGHSKYSNRVQLALHQGQPVVYGNESGGSFVELRDAASGDLIVNERVDDQRREPPLAEAVYYELALLLASRSKHDIQVDDFLSRHVLETRYPPGEARERAFRESVRYLDGIGLQGDRFILHLTLVQGAQGWILRGSRHEPGSTESRKQ